MARGSEKVRRTMADPKPNILLLFTDQQRADTIGAGGNPVIRTPGCWCRTTPGRIRISRAIPGTFERDVPTGLSERRGPDSGRNKSAFTPCKRPPPLLSLFSG